MPSFRFKLLASALILIAPSLLSLNTFAASTPLILITELQTGQGGSEFIEIENTSDSTIDLAQWRLQYHGTTSTTWSNKALTFTDPLITLLDPGDRALFSASGYSPPNSEVLAHFPSGLADSGGSVRFLPLSLDESLGSVLTWGTPDPPTCSIAPKHSDGQSLKRFPSGDGALVNTGISGEDFYVSNSPSPDSIDDQDPFSIDEVVNYCGKPEEILEDPQAPGTTQDPGSPPPPTYLPILITELFPDPVTPQKDEEDEYIELFNPNSEPVNLSGYKLQSGLNSTYSYVLGDLTLQPGEYYAISRKDSKLTLSNSSSKATLLDPDGTVLSEAEPYEKSYQAMSWQLYNGIWQWSSSPTPSAQNVQLSLTATTTSTASKVTAKPAAKAAKKTTAKKASTKKAATTKVSSVKKETEPSSFTYTDEQGNTKLKPYIIWGAGLLLFGYGLWEYRWDLLNLLKRRRQEEQSQS